MTAVAPEVKTEASLLKQSVKPYALASARGKSTHAELYIVRRAFANETGGAVEHGET